MSNNDISYHKLLKTSFFSAEGGIIPPFQHYFLEIPSKKYPFNYLFSNILKIFIKVFPKAKGILKTRRFPLGGGNDSFFRA